jgi:hypothetical protein
MAKPSHVASRVSISSSAEPVDGNAEHHRSIPAIDSPDYLTKDSAGEIINDLAPAQSARTSRRVFMNSIVSAASLVAAAKVVAPSVVKAETAADGDDPIFAAIGRERTLNDAFLARARYEDDLAERGMEVASDDSRSPEMVAIVDASVAARVALANTAPTTLRGLIAYLDYVIAEGEKLSSEDLPVFFFDGEEETTNFVRSLARCVHGLCAGVSPAT